MAEVMAVVLAETETYPLSACISDTGGAAGLFLGLNVIGNYYYHFNYCLLIFNLEEFIKNNDYHFKGILSLLKKTSDVSKMNCRKLNLF